MPGNILDSLVSCLSRVMGSDGDALDRQHFNDFEIVVFQSHFGFPLSLCPSGLLIEKIICVFIYIRLVSY